MEAYLNDNELPMLEESRVTLFKNVLFNENAKKFAIKMAFRRFDLRIAMR